MPLLEHTHCTECGVELKAVKAEKVTVTMERVTGKLVVPRVHYYQKAKFACLDCGAPVLVTDG